MHDARHTSPVLIADALELAELERTRAPWAPRLASMRSAGLHMLAGDDDTGGDGGDDKSGGRKDDTGGDRDDDRDDTRRRERDDDRDRDKPRDRDKDDDKDDDDKVDPDLAASRKAAERYRKERDELRKDREREQREANEKSGKFEELYTTERKRADDLELELNTFKATTYAERALQAAGARSPQRAARLLDLKTIESEDDAEREVRALKREDPDLFKSGRRQTRTRDDEDDRDTRDRDRDRDRDDDRDTRRDRDRDRDDDRTPKILGPERMRRHFEDKTRDRDRDRR